MEYLEDYVKFVDHTTSRASKDPDYFMESCEIVEEQGLSPERLMTAALGICAEGGEFAEVVKKGIFQGKPLDEDARYHMRRELGDVMWYIAQACIALDTTIEQIIDMNIGKLEDRYPNGFEIIRSENRNEDDI